MIIFNIQLSILLELTSGILVIFKMFGNQKQQFYSSIVQSEYSLLQFLPTRRLFFTESFLKILVIGIIHSSLKRKTIYRIVFMKSIDGNISLGIPFSFEIFLYCTKAVYPLYQLDSTSGTLMLFKTYLKQNACLYSTKIVYHTRVQFCKHHIYYRQSYSENTNS